MSTLAEYAEVLADFDQRLPTALMLRHLAADGVTWVTGAHLRDWRRRGRISYAADGWLPAEVYAYLAYRPRRLKSDPKVRLLCLADGCWGAHHAAGLCGPHYRLARRHTATCRVLGPGLKRLPHLPLAAACPQRDVEQLGSSPGS